MFRRFIPAKGINLPGIRIQPPNATETLIHSNDTLVFWILHTGTKKWNTAPMYQRAIAFDENGNELENLAGAMGLISGTNVYSRWEIQAFPRNGKTVGLRILEDTGADTRRPVAEFVTKNPTPVPTRTGRQPRCR